MSNETLKDKFRSSVIPDHYYWSSSLNPRVQFMQAQGAKGTRSATSTAFASGTDDVNEARRQESEQTSDMLSWALDQALQRYNEATRAAEIALATLDTTLITARERLLNLRAQFDANTIKLDDGTHVYLDTDTNVFVTQNSAGTWSNLENPDDIKSALSAAAEKNGRVTTKQGMLALDAYEQEIISGSELYAKNRTYLSSVDELVKSGEFSAEHGALAKELATSDMEEMSARILEKGRAAEAVATPVALQLEHDVKSGAIDQLSAGTGTLELGIAFQAAFEDLESSSDDLPVEDKPAPIPPYAKAERPNFD